MVPSTHLSQLTAQLAHLLVAVLKKWPCGQIGLHWEEIRNLSVKSQTVQEVEVEAEHSRQVISQSSQVLVAVLANCLEGHCYTHWPALKKDPSGQERH
jgi:hypothetical protein